MRTVLILLTDEGSSQDSQEEGDFSDFLKSLTEAIRHSTNEKKQNRRSTFTWPPQPEF